ncbi:unnamed protein product [Absidia cylindrospora]
MDLDGSLNLINHRGPDSRGVYVSSDGRCGLGHARLSIIDLAGGQQPLSNMSNNIHAVVNGELYDHDRLLLELQEKGHQFKTKSDSELALHYYEDYDTDFVENLRGEFAIAIWDERKSRLVLARDRFGIKPVYYTQINGTFMAASEIKYSWHLVGSLNGMSTLLSTMAQLLTSALVSKACTRSPLLIT